MAAVVIIVAPVEEILVIVQQIRINLKMAARTYQSDGKDANSIQEDGADVGLVPLNSDRTYV